MKLGYLENVKIWPSNFFSFPWVNHHLIHVPLN